jgi:hypothetical protein
MFPCIIHPGTTFGVVYKEELTSHTTHMKLEKKKRGGFHLVELLCRVG